MEYTCILTTILYENLSNATFIKYSIKEYPYNYKIIHKEEKQLLKKILKIL
jgi:hypothetical protein